MKKKFLIVSVIALLCLSVLATWAYFSAEETTTNVISTGAVDMELFELGAGNTLYDEGMVFENVMPGMTLDKKPVIKNVDAQSFYTRAKAVVKIKYPNGSGQYESFDNYKQYIALDIDENYWVSDGEWYYYKGYEAAENPNAADGEVAPGEEVTFFSKVMIDPGMGNEYQNCTITITVEAQAVQVKNNEVDEHYNGDYTQIEGWPATPQA